MFRKKKNLFEFPCNWQSSNNYVHDYQTASPADETGWGDVVVAVLKECLKPSGSDVKLNRPV